MRILKHEFEMPTGEGYNVDVKVELAITGDLFPHYVQWDWCYGNPTKRLEILVLNAMSNFPNLVDGLTRRAYRLARFNQYNEFRVHYLNPIVCENPWDLGVRANLNDEDYAEAYAINMELLGENLLKSNSHVLVATGPQAARFSHYEPLVRGIGDRGICLGITKKGFPKHILSCTHTTPFVKIRNGEQLVNPRR